MKSEQNINGATTSDRGHFLKLGATTGASLLAASGFAEPTVNVTRSGPTGNAKKKSQRSVRWDRGNSA